MMNNEIEFIKYDKPTDTEKYKLTTFEIIGLLFFSSAAMIFGGISLIMNFDKLLHP